ncbi:MAG: hypothetical protein M1820_001526 [Bogoriella megaspora]|nr:MAG: hypothetical protein M1820_001526 [Bogoriella megaspora]
MEIKLLMGLAAFSAIASTTPIIIENPGPIQNRNGSLCRPFYERFVASGSGGTGGSCVPITSMNTPQTQCARDMGGCPDPTDFTPGAGLHVGAIEGAQASKRSAVAEMPIETETPTSPPIRAGDDTPNYHEHHHWRHHHHHNHTGNWTMNEFNWTKYREHHPTCPPGMSLMTEVGGSHVESHCVPRLLPQPLITDQGNTGGAGGMANGGASRRARLAKRTGTATQPNVTSSSDGVIDPTSLPLNEWVPQGWKPGDGHPGFINGTEAERRFREKFRQDMEKWRQALRQEGGTQAQGQR